jgi:hypothetical protein
MTHVINDDDAKSKKKMLRKYPSRNFKYSKSIRGSFKIIGYRKYEYIEEIDIEFNGDIFARRNDIDPKIWVSSNILDDTDVSIIKANRIIRRHSFPEIKDYLSYFGIELDSPSDIKKIKWN